MPDSSTRVAVPHQRHGLAQSIEAASLAIPFRVKVAAVWAVIFALLAFGFFRSGFDIEWMIDKTPAIVKGVWVTILFSVIAITAATILALLGAVPAWPHSRSWGYGPSGALGVVVLIIVILLLMATANLMFHAAVLGWLRVDPLRALHAGLALIVMMVAADPLANFINDNPTVVMLALGFLIMIGMTLIAEGFGAHVPKGYVYAAMAFSTAIEMLNIFARRARLKREAAQE